MDNSIDKLITYLAKMPGLGKRSATRQALALLQKRDQLLAPLADVMREAYDKVKVCEKCGNFDEISPCHICQNPMRDQQVVCVVKDIADLWAMERMGSFKGTYFILGGLLSASGGTTPESLNIPKLKNRIKEDEIKEIIFALPLTIEGKTTQHYISAELGNMVKCSELAHGVPIGGELEFLDDGTLAEALKSRKEV